MFTVKLFMERLTRCVVIGVVAIVFYNIGACQEAKVTRGVEMEGRRCLASFDEHLWVDEEQAQDIRNAMIVHRTLATRVCASQIPTPIP